VVVVVEDFVLEQPVKSPAVNVAIKKRTKILAPNFFILLILLEYKSTPKIFKLPWHAGFVYFNTPAPPLNA
jgi:hypothetical protein